MENLFNIILYQPFLNLLIFIYNILPGRDFGVAVVVVTVIVRLILMPLSIKALLSQRSITKIQPKLKELQKKHKHDKETLSRETMAMYKEHGVNPLSGCLPILIQLPILLALYSVFSSGFKEASFEFLYSFIPNPGAIPQLTFGLFDISQKSPIVAVLAGVLQLIQTKLTNANQPAGANQQDNPMAMMNKQMLYFFPIFITIIAWNLPFGLTLYWVTTTLFSILEQVYIRIRHKHT